jgi:hypothetical protein
MFNMHDIVHVEFCRKKIWYFLHDILVIDGIILKIIEIIEYCQNLWFNCWHDIYCNCYI